MSKPKRIPPTLGWSYLSPVNGRIIRCVVSSKECFAKLPARPRKYIEVAVVPLVDAIEAGLVPELEMTEGDEA